jgi:hypothetical protein
MSQLSLSEIVIAWIERVGTEDAAAELLEKLGKKYAPATLKSWKSGRIDPPLAVAQMVWDAGRIEWTSPETLFEGSKIYIVSPVYDRVSFLMYKASHILRYRYEKQLGILTMMGSELALLRNKLADRFLETGAEWALWLDSDMAPPMGYPAESRKWGSDFADEYNQVDVLEKLMSHGKTIVSAVYFDRWGQGIPMFAEGRNDASVARGLRGGPRNELRSTEWVGAGCCLVHRKVYEDMLEKIPEIRRPNDQTPNGYYTPIDNGFGEDTSFCLRAKTAGHETFVDLGCFSGHVGEIAHYNKKIR